MLVSGFLEAGQRSRYEYRSIFHSGRFEECGSLLFSLPTLQLIDSVPRETEGKMVRRTLARNTVCAVSESCLLESGKVMSVGQDFCNPRSRCLLVCRVGLMHGVCTRDRWMSGGVWVR